MNTEAEKRPSFFKLVCDTQTTRLFEYGSTFPKNVKLRIESGRKWDVKVEAIENGMFCFGKGWETFARDVGLKSGEALLFTFDHDGSTLDVKLFGAHCCESEFPPSIPVIEISDEDSECEVMNSNPRGRRSVGIPAKRGRGRPPIRGRKPPVNFVDADSASDGNKLDDPDLTSYFQAWRHKV